MICVVGFKIKLKTTINSDHALFQFCLLFLPFPPPTNVRPATSSGFLWPPNNIDTFVKTISF